MDEHTQGVATNDARANDHSEGRKTLAKVRKKP